VPDSAVGQAFPHHADWPPGKTLAGVTGRVGGRPGFAAGRSIELRTPLAGQRTLPQVTGPAVGVCWGAALIVARLWTWHIPVMARLGVGTALAVVVLVLATAATSRHSYRRTRLAIVGGAGLAVLDSVMITGVLVLAPALTWLLIAAILVSVGRIGFAVRSLPRTLVR
jgi:hypothetical protein